MRAVAALRFSLFLDGGKTCRTAGTKAARRFLYFHIRLDAISYDLTSRLVRLVQVYSILSLLLHQTR